MSGGALRTGWSYLRQSSVEIVRYGIFVPFFCSVTLLAFLSTEQFGAFALYTVIGMVCYFSQLAISTEDDELEESKAVKLVLSVIIVLYLNVLVFLGTLTGVFLASLGFDSTIPTILLLFSLIDAELGRRELPSLTLLTGFCVSAVLFVAELFGGAEPMAKTVEAFDEIQSRLNEDSPGFLHDELIRRTERSSLPWV